jgi:ATP-binding cassette subfamily C protein LapB
VVAPLAGLSIIAAANMIGWARSREAASRSAAIAHQRANQLNESLGAIETIKAMTAESQLLTRWEARTDEGAYMGHLARHNSALAAHISIMAVQLTIVLTLIIGVYETGAGMMTMGALAASSLLVGRAMSPMGNLVALLARSFHLMRASGLLERLEEAQIERGGDVARQRGFDGKIVLANVSCAYEGAGRPALENISLAIRPGERVAIIGRIGSGKSTLLRLMLRLAEPTSGGVHIDGRDIAQFDPAFLRRHMALMPQDAVLLDGSLRDNICLGLGADCLDEEEFGRIAAISGVAAFAARSPQGYSMAVGARGERLSGGERAAVSLARAMARNPRVLLLDEPTAAMDNDLERHVIAGLDEWLEGRTLVMATHRAPALALASRVIWLHQGRVALDGPRDEALAKLKG